MKIVETTFERLPRERLVIGFEGENLRATVRIDCASVFAEYPNATPSLIVKPLFADAYPVVVDRNGTDVDWLITSEILSFSGDGEIQLVFYKDEVIYKSAVSKIRVCRSLQVTGEMPDPVVQWIENANRKLAEVDAQIVELEGMVDTATDAATRAEQSASTASTKAEQAAGSAATATEKATEATNAAGTATAKAAEAEQSALTATDKANAAAESERIATAKAAEATTAAGTATAKAEQATGAAQTATEKAGDASASARAAHASEINAAESADDALSAEVGANAAKRAAETSATQAAQSAQGASADAQTATQKAAEAQQSATGAAQSEQTATQKATDAAASAQAASDAKTAVEQTAEQLADSLEQIEQNTRDIADHEQYAEATYATKDDLYKKADIIKNTASGAISSFPDGADGHLVDELKVAIEPVQDLHGYDHPWPAGGGKNKFDISSASIKKWQLNSNSFTTRPDSYAYISYTVNADDESVTVVTMGTYMGICFDVSAGSSVRVFSQNETVANTILLYSAYEDGATLVNSSAKSCTIPTETTGVVAALFYAVGTYTIKFQLEEGSTASSWTPYSNICPITGWDGVKVTRTGKNLFDKAQQTHLYCDGSFFTYTNADITSVYVPLLPNTTYTFSQSVAGGFSRYGLIDALENHTGIYNPLSPLNKGFISHTSLPFTFTNTNRKYLLCTIYRASVDTDKTFDEIADSCQLEYGSTATDYEPYAGNTYEVTLPTEAGTVYGGELTVNADGSGSLVVDRAMVDLGTLAFSYDSSGKRWQIIVPDIVNYPSRNANILAEKYAADVTAIAGDIGKMFTTGKGLYIYDIDNENAPSGSFVYPLATPQTYTLTPTEIRTLLGQNNIWADTGDVSVKYNADTKLYIDNKITQAIAAALNS